LLLFFNFLMVLMDGLGLTMFIPLLQIADGNANVDGANAKLIELTTHAFQLIGVPMNVVTMLVFIVILFAAKGIFSYKTLAYQVITLNAFIRKIRAKNSLGLSELNFKDFVSSDVGRLQNTLTGEANLVVSACRSYI